LLNDSKRVARDAYDGEVMSSIILFLALAGAFFLLGYVASWLINGRLVKRINNTRFYMKKGHTLKRAWLYAGLTL
jgi:hypothetical protein